ncbi:acyltransferase [Microbacterium sp.]|uniref:acyltransferase family protein n=1 Tax=Microbacterium sp. TaxID=51671 RepID=UPI00289D59B8|nr:acyltransferase [Microbacterium sp.]
MTVVDAPPLAAHRPSVSSDRDTGIDFLRALCVVGVVLLHAIMVGVTVVDGSPVFANASEGTWWITPVSWMLQVMPLFFIIGGFAGLIAYRRQSERGGTASAFVASRVHRLLRPATVVVGIVGAALAALSLAGVPADIVATAGFRYGQPLWFLGVFLLCQALLPALADAHGRMPKTVLAALVLAALGIDALRAQTGIEGLGFVNLAFVWLALQQVGFFLADGTVDRLSRRIRGIVGAASLTALTATFLSGVYSPDLIANINPPTCALILVGIVHLCAVSLLRDRISDVSRRPAAAAFSRFVNRRTMTVYLWHMPVLLAMAGGSAASAMIAGLPLPEPSSLEWWLSRPLWLVAALALTAVVAIALTSIETHPAPTLSRSGRRIAAAVTIGLLAVVLLLVAGTSVLTAGVAVLGLLFARRLARGSHQSAGREGVADVVRVA